MANLPNGAYRSGSFDCQIIYDTDDLPIGYTQRGKDVYFPSVNTDPLTGGAMGLNANGATFPIAGVQAEAFGASSTATPAQNTASIQAALNVGGVVRISAVGVYLVNATLTVGSNTHVVIDEGVTIKMADGSGRCCIFVNKNTQSGDTNISITGRGTLDFNYQNIGATVSDVRLMGVRLTNVTNSLIQGISLLNCLKYHVHITKCTNFTVRDLFIKTQSVGGDGVHVHGNTSIGLIENIRGQSGDDFIALNVKDVSNWLDPVTPSLSIGPINDVTVRNITGSVYSANSGACVAVYSNVTGSPTVITGASWTAGVVTVTCPGLTAPVGGFVQIAGVTPSTYNGNYRCLTSSSGTFTFQMDDNPGTYTSGGTVDVSYDMKGLVVENIKPSMVNAGHTVNLGTFPSPSTGGTINDIVVSDVRPETSGGRVIYVNTSIGTLDATEIRHSAGSAANLEMMFSEQGFTHETWNLHKFSNELPFTGTLGALIKLNSPVKNLKMTDFKLQVAGSGTSGVMLTNSTSSTTFPYESVELANFSVYGRQSNVGLAALELGTGKFPAVSASNMSVANMVAGIKTNGGTGNVNMNINGAQAKNISGGSGFVVLYAVAVTQISVCGYTPRENVFGAFNFLVNTTTGGAVTMVKAAGSPNYAYTFPWFSAATPGSGSSLYADGHEIKVDVSKIARWDGSLVYNTNAALGTLAAAGLVSCQGVASNSWSLLSDPTKKY